MVGLQVCAWRPASASLSSYTQDGSVKGQGIDLANKPLFDRTADVDAETYEDASRLACGTLRSVLGFLDAVVYNIVIKHTNDGQKMQRDHKRANKTGETTTRCGKPKTGCHKTYTNRTPAPLCSSRDK